MLDRYLEAHPQHPGLHNYLIHAYDSPELTPEAEEEAQRYDQLAPAIGHYVHALDYMMYAYLQMGDEENARRTLARIRDVEGIWPVLAFAYGLAAPQARFYLECHDWEGAARLEPRQPAVLDKHPITPGEVLRVRELHAEMLLLEGRPTKR